MYIIKRDFCTNTKESNCIILDDSLKAGEIGELVVSGRHLVLGYWRSDEENALRYRQHPLGIGRALYTGDEFKMDDEGYLYYIGRSDDQIKRNGFRIQRL